MLNAPECRTPNIKQALEGFEDDWWSQGRMLDARSICSIYGRTCDPERPRMPNAEPSYWLRTSLAYSRQACPFCKRRLPASDAVHGTFPLWVKSVYINACGSFVRRHFPTRERACDWASEWTTEERASVIIKHASFRTHWTYSGLSRFHHPLLSWLRRFPATRSHFQRLFFKVVTYGPSDRRREKIFK